MLGDMVRDLLPFLKFKIWTKSFVLNWLKMAKKLE
jgi:hypothetical protein